MQGIKRSNRPGFRGDRSVASLQENMELLTGQRGDGLDKALTVRELVQLGVIGAQRSSTGAIIPKPLPPLLPDDGIVEMPNAPVGFYAYGGFGSIMLEWEKPSFKGYAHTEIWRATPLANDGKPSLDNAVLIATTPATVFGDVVTPGSTFYYWIRFININDIAGPYNDVDGTKVSTSPNISDIIDDIGNQMKESELVKDLVSDISKVHSDAQAAIDNAKDAFEKVTAKIQSDYKDADKKIHSSIKVIEQSITDAEESISQLGTQLRTEFKDADNHLSSEITQLDKTVVTKTKALAEAIKQLETHFTNADNELSSLISQLEQSTTQNDEALAQQITTIKSTINDVSATVQHHSQTISKLNQDGSAAHQALWSVKAQAGDIKAGIGILADSNGKSQVAVAASQFFVFDPNVEGGATQPLFVIDKGNVVIPKAFIETATIQILNAQTIVADEVKAGISIKSPVIEGGSVTGGWAGFGPGGRYNGWRTYINESGQIFTDGINAVNGSYSGHLYATSGEMRNVLIHKNCEIKGHLNGATGHFNGTVYVEHLVGDVVDIVDVEKNNEATIKAVRWPRKIKLIPVSLFVKNRSTDNYTSSVRGSIAIGGQVSSAYAVAKGSYDSDMAMLSMRTVYLPANQSIKLRFFDVIQKGGIIDSVASFLISKVG